MTELLAGMRLLTQADRAALTLYCQAWSTMVSAQSHVRDNGAIVKSPNGYPIQNPYLSVANAAAKQLRGILSEFGLTPASRSKVHAPELPDVDPMDEFLSEARGTRNTD